MLSVWMQAPSLVRQVNQHRNNSSKIDPNRPLRLIPSISNIEGALHRLFFLRVRPPCPLPPGYQSVEKCYPIHFSRSPSCKSFPLFILAAALNCLLLQREENKNQEVPRCLCFCKSFIPVQIYQPKQVASFFSVMVKLKILKANKKMCNCILVK
jgi:hypothetical protein